MAASSHPSSTPQAQAEALGISLDLVGDHLAGGYESEMDIAPRRKRFDADIPMAPKPTAVAHDVPRKIDYREEFDRHERIRHARNVLAGMTAYERHQRFINDYVMFYNGGERYFRENQPTRRNDFDVIREEHRFLWESRDTVSMDWEKQLAKRYHDKLFKEYCLANLTHYKANKIALRWRTEQEVFEGKGQFVCGSLVCAERNDLTSWEVNFAYQERGERRKALVKLRLCRKCSRRLNYHSRKTKAAKPAAQSPAPSHPVQAGLQHDRSVAKRTASAASRSSVAKVPKEAAEELLADLLA